MFEGCEIEQGIGRRTNRPEICLGRDASHMMRNQYIIQGGNIKSEWNNYISNVQSITEINNYPVGMGLCIFQHSDQFANHNQADIDENIVSE